MTNVPLLITIAAILLGLGIGAGVWWYRRTHPMQKWELSTNPVDGTEGARTDPQDSWWMANVVLVGGAWYGMGGDSVLVLTDKWRTIIDHLSSDIFRTWLYVPDPNFNNGGFSPVDQKTKRGDCEDYARVFALRLIKEKNIDPGCLTLFMGAPSADTWHCVLGIKTDQGVYYGSVGREFVLPCGQMPMARLQRIRADGMPINIV